MDESTYAAIVIGQVYSDTLEGRIKWKINRDSLSADPISSITVTISFKDKGPNSAEWERVVITHPVGRGLSSIVHPGDHFAKYSEPVSKETLEKINQLFDQLVLAPRLKEFEAALAELARK